MSDFTQIDTLLRQSAPDPTHEPPHSSTHDAVADFARYLSEIENLVVVVSDMATNTSAIYAGRFASTIGLQSYTSENSIWEKTILSLMPQPERDEKFRAELRFYHYLRHLPRQQRRDYYMASRLRFVTPSGGAVDVLHRMYYIYRSEGETIRYAVCLYGPLPPGFSGRSLAVNSVTGLIEELTSSTDSKILSRRELQVLRLIDSGKKTAEIASILSVSPHTVSRHRQQIITRLRVTNSVEACSLAKSLHLL